MNFQSNAIFLFLTLLSSISFAQSKKAVKKYDIQSVTETVTIKVNGKELSYIESFTTYDKEGRVISMTEYNSDKTIKKQETATYDKQGNKIQETSLKTEDALKPKVNFKRINTKFNAQNDKIEEIQYDASNKIVKKEVYGYNKWGQKNSILVYDGEGKIIKKQTVTFNDKGLKSEKTTVDENNKFISTKRYTYEFY